MMRNVWFSSASDKGSEMRFFCFPYAGAGTTVYTEWAKQMDMDFFPVSYPMREKRRSDPMPLSIQELAYTIAIENETIFAEKPSIFYGHCEGGIIAYETAVAVQKIYGISPKLFVISGVNPPCRPLRLSIAETMNLEEASEKFVELGFIPKQFAKNQTYLKCFVPVLLEDFILFQKYCDRDYWKLSCPIFEIHGREDVSLDMAHLTDWDRYTDQITHNVYDGGHFFINRENLSEIMVDIRKVIDGSF
jgi:surfactin synthase thioesterase subunit